MPRPKKAGAPEPKKRSRNGCWPCKGRKVKCTEEKPSCLNCQRQGEVCDYSIRLNWEGRGKKKSDGSEGSGQITFSASIIHSIIGSPSDISSISIAQHTTPSEPFNLRSTEISSVATPLVAFDTSAGRIDLQGRKSQHYVPYNLSDGYGLSTQQESIGSPPISASMAAVHAGDGSLQHDPFNSGRTESDHRYNGDAEVFYAEAQVQAGMTQRPAMQRVRSELSFKSSLPSPSDSSVDSSSIGTLTGVSVNTPTSTPPIFGQSRFEDDLVAPDVTSYERPPKRVRYGYPGVEITLSRAGDMPPPVGTPAYMHSNSYASQILPSYSLNDMPLTPATLTQGEDTFRTMLTKISPYATQEPSDPRRLSVESLLSGPPGISYEYHQGYGRRSISDSIQSPSANCGIPEEYTTYGIDRGFKDLDIGKNNDINAISGGSPVATREHLDLVLNDEGQYTPVEFGFGIHAKDTEFEGGSYYAQPVTINIPKSFEPLPPSLLENPMNLLYFHHFISHTARILVPHHCSSNPFQHLLPQMALLDSNLMSLLLAYSASHRARLLQQPEPATRIALWVQDIFPNLRHALNDPNGIVSNSNLASAIMLASLEIISPKAFGIDIPWRQHLDTAREMISARGSSGRMNSAVSKFLLRWFSYLDVIGSLIGGPTDIASSTDSNWTVNYDNHRDDENQIDCLLGFTGRCISILAKIADLARICAATRIGPDHNIRKDWKPCEEMENSAERLILDTEDALSNTMVQPCPHLHSIGEATDQWDNRQIVAVNEAYHWAGLVHLHRRVLGKPSNHPDVQMAVREIIGKLYKIRKGSTAEACLLFPMFTAGCDSQDNRQKALIMDRLMGVEEFGMSQVRKARRLMEKVWETGKPWETLVSGEFVG